MSSNPARWESIRAALVAIREMQSPAVYRR